ncbi:hypothetical protein NEIG_01186 [Nematocida sp. ERTm5]|nr:hypothetical protein NEIG_01186 [Nematocida sp. ERTm5]
MTKWELDKAQKAQKEKLINLLQTDYAAFISQAIKIKVPHSSAHNPKFRFSDVHSYNYDDLKRKYNVDGEVNASLIENPDGLDFIAMEYPTAGTIDAANELLQKSKCGLVISLIGDHPPWESDFLDISYTCDKVFSPEEFISYAIENKADTNSVSTYYADMHEIIKEENGNFLIEKHTSRNSPTDIIFRIKCMCWIDKTPPTGNLVKTLDILKSVWESMHLSSGPVTVHCLAGVGRTGTFIFYNMFRTAIMNADGAAMSEAEKISIFVELFLYLRSKRTWMVENKEQLMFLYKLLIDKNKKNFEA